MCYKPRFIKGLNFGEKELALEKWETFPKACVNEDSFIYLILTKQSFPYPLIWIHCSFILLFFHKRMVDAFEMVLALY